MEHDTWRAAGRALVAKMIAELSYEELLQPVPAGEPGQWTFELAGARYDFRTRRGAFGHWHVDPASVRRDGAAAEDPTAVVLDGRGILGFDGVTTSEVLRDLLATHRADSYLASRALPAPATADLSYEALEAHQTGHPCLILNKGRLGFSGADVKRFAPEAAPRFRLPWLAAAPGLARRAGADVLEHELDPTRRAAFAARLDEVTAGRGDGYVWFPVHPFHLDEAITTLFARELASGELVVLGEGPDRYQPLQSIRTLTNIDCPEGYDVKLPLLIRNTLVWRGIAPAPTAAAPAVTSWLHETLRGDAFLRDECRMVVLGEIASVTVDSPLFDAVSDAPYRYHELLGALWREPVRSYLGPGERARTMASLLHVGGDGVPLVAELVSRAGTPAETWLRALFGAVLPPLLHWLYRYGVAFCPHGENTVLVFDVDGLPARIAVKDLAEDVNLLPEPLPEQVRLPPEADAVLLRWPAHDLRHAVISAVLAGHFRFLAPLVEDHLEVPEARFWHLVREVVDEHHDRFPELRDRIDRFGILDAEVERICLNREQLRGAGFHDRVEKDESFDVVDGVVPNPLHGRG